MRESFKYGSVRGAVSNDRPYRDNRFVDRVACLGYRWTMGRPKRSNSGGWDYHVLNRSNAQTPIFKKVEDFVACERVLEEAVAGTGTRLLAGI